MKELVVEWVKKAEGDAGTIMYRALALLLKSCVKFNNILVKSFKTQDYKKVWLLEPGDSNFVNVKPLNLLLYKDLYDLYNIENYKKISTFDILKYPLIAIC